MNRTALVIGATGLVGQELLKVLLDQDYYQTVKIVTRRSLEITDPKLEVILLKDFDQMTDIQHELVVDDYFCCLGTTIKTAGSKEVFKKVDLEYPYQLAKIAKRASSSKAFLIVTAAGSDSKSTFFYNRVKGELEERLKELGLSNLKIFQPTMLLGDREEFRFGELVGKWIIKAISFVIPNHWSIKASDVAKSMFLTARSGKDTTETLDAKTMVQLAKNYNT